jgi:hypothetical protein
VIHGAQYESADDFRAVLDRLLGAAERTGSA